MTTKYFALLTNQGAAKLANAAALGTKVNITQMAVGDGGGTLPTPDPAQTKLIGEKRRTSLNSLTIDAANGSQIIAEQIIPEGEGGFWIREIGLFDADGVMIAVANCAETYKPQLAEGSGRTQTVRMIIIVNSTSAVTLKIDPSVVLATRQYVDDKVLEVRQYADGLLDAHIKAADPHTQYAPKASPTFTGSPKAPTAAAGNNSTQLANTAFVQAALAALAGSAPAALDTLKELADALGNDPNFSATVLDSLAGKMDIAKNGSDISDVATFLKNLGISDKFSGRLLKVSRFTDSAAYQKPNARLLKITVTGGGGGGGGSAAAGTSQGAVGSGGGAGGTSVSWYAVEDLVFPVTLTVGKGGAGGVGTNEPQPGQSSSFGKYLSAANGARGASGTAFNYGDNRLLSNGGGGTGVGGNFINSKGGAGTPAITLSTGYESGGGGASFHSGGGNPIAAGIAYPGEDGALGSGGSGGFSVSNSAAQSGGKGGDGIIIIEEFA